MIVERPNGGAWPLTDVNTETFYNLQIRDSTEAWNMFTNLGAPAEYRMWDSTRHNYRLQVHGAMQIYLQHLSNEFQSWWNAAA